MYVLAVNIVLFIVKGGGVVMGPSASVFVTPFNTMELGGLAREIVQVLAMLFELQLLTAVTHSYQTELQSSTPKEHVGCGELCVRR